MCPTARHLRAAYAGRMGRSPPSQTMCVSCQPVYPPTAVHKLTSSHSPHSPAPSIRPSVVLMLTSGLATLSAERVGRTSGCASSASCLLSSSLFLRCLTLCVFLGRGWEQLWWRGSPEPPGCTPHRSEPLPAELSSQSSPLSDGSSLNHRMQTHEAVRCLFPLRNHCSFLVMIQ